MTRRNLYFGWFSTDLWEESQRTEEFGIFYREIGNRWRQSTFTDGWCRGNIPCTSYSRTNDYVILWLRQHHAWAQCDEQHGHRRAHERAQHAVLSTLRAVHWCTIVSHRTCWLKSASSASSHPCMCTCVLRLGCFLLACLCSLLRPTVLLPALPDVYLSAQREVQVQPPEQLPLGDRGHSRIRETPHRTEGFGLILNQGNILSLRTKFRRK